VRRLQRSPFGFRGLLATLLDQLPSAALVRAIIATGGFRRPLVRIAVMLRRHQYRNGREIIQNKLKSLEQGQEDEVIYYLASIGYFSTDV
jgi:hypothetical protein